VRRVQKILDISASYAVCPVVRGLEKTDAFEAQVIAVAVLIRGVEDVEGDLGQVFSGRHDIHDHGLMLGDGRQKVIYLLVAAIDQKSVIPYIDQFFLRDAFDVGKIHHHALLGLPFGVDDVAGQRDFDRIAVAVQVSALAVVVGDAVSGIEFKAAGDEHDQFSLFCVARIIPCHGLGNPLAAYHSPY
jgi:hypothetical protein